LIALIWFSLTTVGLEIVILRGDMPAGSPEYATTAGRITMHIGSVGVIV